MLTAHIRLEQKRPNNPYVHYPFVGNYQTKRGRQCVHALFLGDASLSDWTRSTLTNKDSAEGAFGASQPLNNSSVGKLPLTGILHGCSWRTPPWEIFRLWLLHVLHIPLYVVLASVFLNICFHPWCEYASTLKTSLLQVNSNISNKQKKQKPTHI